MYCPKCGTSISNDDMLFGGCCSYRCSECGFCIYCYDVFTDELEEDTKPIFNPVKAWLLRFPLRHYNRKERK